MRLRTIKINKKLGTIFSQTDKIDSCLGERVNDITANIIYPPLTEMRSQNLEIIYRIKNEFNNR